MKWKRWSIRSWFIAVFVVAVLAILCVHVRGVNFRWECRPTDTFFLMSVHWHHRGETFPDEYGIWYTCYNFEKPERRYGFGLVPH